MANRLVSAGLALCAVAALAACETPTVYEPMPAAKLVSHATAQRPNFTPGDEFWYHIGGSSIMVEEYEGVKDGLHAFRRALQNVTVLYTPDLAVARIDHAFANDEIFEPDNGELDFPLAIGKTWTREYRVRSEITMYATKRTRSCEVLDFGQAETQAGEFIAYRIVCTLTELGTAGVEQEEVLYSPDVGRIINRRVLGGGTTLNLIEYKRAL